MQHFTRAELKTAIGYRVQNDARTGEEQIWNDTDLEKALSTAIQALVPVGVPVVYSLTGSSYALATQPAVNFTRILSIEIKASGQDFSHQVGDRNWRMLGNGNASKWLWLRYPPRSTDTVVVHALETVLTTESPVRGDAEFLTLYAMSALYERLLELASDLTLDEALTKLTMYRQAAMLRRAELLQDLGLTPTPLPSTPAQRER